MTARRPVIALTSGEPAGICQLHPGKFGSTMSAFVNPPTPSEVRFQKASRVTVRLATSTAIAPDVSGVVVRQPRKPWYSSGWVYLGAGVVAVAAGVIIGRELGEPTVVRCEDGGCK